MTGRAAYTATELAWHEYLTDLAMEASGAELASEVGVTTINLDVRILSTDWIITFESWEVKGPLLIGQMRHPLGHGIYDQAVALAHVVAIMPIQGAT